MKTRVIFILMMTMGIMVFSFGQEQKSEEMKTLFKNTDKKIDHGGYFGLSVGYTQVDGNNSLTLGGRAAWLIDHHVAIGLGGNSFISEPFVEGDFPNVDQAGLYLMGGYGGLLIEPILAPNFPVHVSFPILIGGGGFVLNEESVFVVDQYDYYAGPYNWDSFFVFEPGVEIELNVIKFFRVGFGVSYRLTSNLHIDELPNDMLNGFNAAVTMKFGKF
jgi:hypothetical protein